MIKLFILWKKTFGPFACKYVLLTNKINVKVWSSISGRTSVFIFLNVHKNRLTYSLNKDKFDKVNKDSTSMYK